MFTKILVANRGEIAVRVMRACEELDISTVAIYSAADKNAGHVRFADEAYNVGPARAAESYLNQDAIIDAARKAGADAIHPGYGFLAENADFAALVENTDSLTWIGPPSTAMEQLGEKTKARQVMQTADVPIVPGTTTPVETPDEVRDFGDEHGFPIAIKAEGGGGGRGMKIVHNESEIEEQLESARREGEAYFDNDSVYLERYLKRPKHIEVQVIADTHGNARHLGERDCSLQRRHQKIIEEGPSPALSDNLRDQITEAARRGVKHADYTNAGTVEFLVADNEFYFLEVNTRIQVEHTVTEEITGIDIVKWQIRVAAGEELSFGQEDVEIRGHSIEFRVNAENPAAEFAPTPGPLSTYDPPGGIGVRVDDAIRQGDEIGGDYDSMIAKLIVHANDRDECLARSQRALKEFEIDGVHTTIPFHRLMLSDETFRSGTHTTSYLDEDLADSAITEAVETWGPTSTEAESTTEEVIEREYTVEVNGKRFEVSLEERGPPPTDRSQHQGSARSARPSRPAETTDESEIDAEGETVTADMQGTILDVNVEEGDEISPGDVLCVLEAMKMENDVVASRAGTVTDVLIAEGDTVDMGDVLVVID